MSCDLVTWLRARLDEDERAADAIENASYMHGVESDAEAEILRFADTDRIRRDVEAKRLRLGEIERELADDPDNDTVGWLLRVEALPYSGEPGYQEEWRP